MRTKHHCAYRNGVRTLRLLLGWVVACLAVLILVALFCGCINHYHIHLGERYDFSGKDVGEVPTPSSPVDDDFVKLLREPIPVRPGPR